MLQGLHCVVKLPTFNANRVSEIKELTTVDQWFHVNSGDNPVDTGTRGISDDCLKESSWVKGPSFLSGTEWLLKLNLVVFSYILSKKSVDDTIHNSTHALTSTSKQSEPVFVWEKYTFALC